MAGLAGTVGDASAQRRSEPDSVRLITSDIGHFWNAVDGATSLDLEARLRDGYLGAGSIGLRAFAPNQIGSAFNLAKDVWNDRARYETARDAADRVARAEPGIRRSLASLKALYPQATLVDVYFVIGRFALGGWTRGDTLVVAAEMYLDPAQLPAIVAHELVHRQQPAPSDSQTLLERAYHEGSADFIGELASGATINPEAQRYGRAHEHALWVEFQRAMNGNDYTAWLYSTSGRDRPRDLGYFFGYRIAEAYYRRSADKSRALREIIEARDVGAILKRSRYTP